MKSMFVMMLILGTAATACIKDGSLPAKEETPDAMPTTEPDAPQPDAPPVVPDAGVEDCPPDAPPPPPAPTLNFTATSWMITSGQSSTLSWTTTNAYQVGCVLNGGQFVWDAFPSNWSVTVSPTITTDYWITCTGPGGSTSSSGTLIVNAPPPQCSCDDDCNDGYVWTGDACNTATGKCTHWATDCGGMQVLPASNAATCQFWGGFGMSEPAPLLGTYAPSSLLAGPAGNGWKASPAHACSVICYGPGADGETTVDIQIEWNGTALQHQQITGLNKGTWDGKNLRY